MLFWHTWTQVYAYTTCGPVTNSSPLLRRIRWRERSWSWQPCANMAEKSTSLVGIWVWFTSLLSLVTSEVCNPNFAFTCSSSALIASLWESEACLHRRLRTLAARDKDSLAFFASSRMNLATLLYKVNSLSAWREWNRLAYYKVETWYIEKMMQCRRCVILYT